MNKIIILIGILSLILLNGCNKEQQPEQPTLNELGWHHLCINAKEFYIDNKTYTPITINNNTMEKICFYYLNGNLYLDGKFVTNSQT